MRRSCVVFIALVACLLAMAAPAAAQGDSFSFPLTTKSAEAKKLFYQGLSDFENLKHQRALAVWQSASLADPNFALAHLYISIATNSPAEEASERERAKTLGAKASPDEQLLIKWLAGAREADYISAIPAMNELLGKHPADKHLLAESVSFYNHLGVREKVVEFANQALAVDPDNVPVLNQLGYAYAFLRQYDKAIETLEKCVKLQPTEPNPEDSLAEILRMAGKYDEALKHYQAALKIDKKFDSSQLGLGDTYMMMGKYDEARQAYAEIAKMVTDDATLIDYGSQAAQTWVRQKNIAEADKAYTALKDRAHSFGFGELESEMLRSVALYHKENAVSLSLLDQAGKELHAHPASADARDSSMALLLRDRVVRMAAGGDKKTMSRAAQALAELTKLAASNRRNAVQRAYHTANGAMLVAEKKYAQAIDELKEDSDGAVALTLLADAYDKLGNKAEADATRKKIANTHMPTIDWAVVSAN